ncbi:unnamed protein product [Amoebophrya sp. A120]|nr:unnamed protein product [Amoebophrya sp. A120]|eukprot:GSA120T00023894001.1
MTNHFNFVDFKPETLPYRTTTRRRWRSTSSRRKRLRFPFRCWAIKMSQSSVQRDSFNSIILRKFVLQAFSYDVGSMYLTLGILPYELQQYPILVY